MKRNAIILAAMGALFAMLGVLWGHWRTSPETPGADATAMLFAQTLSDAGGQAHDMGQWRNKTLVVNFWATWCAPCVEEMPELSKLHDEIAPTGKHVLGIGIDSPENIAPFAAKFGINFPIYVGGIAATELSRSLGNVAGGLPYTVLIDSSGAVRKTYLGRLKMDELRKDLAKL